MSDYVRPSHRPAVVWAVTTIPTAPSTPVDWQVTTDNREIMLECARHVVDGRRYGSPMHPFDMQQMILVLPDDLMDHPAPALRHIIDMGMGTKVIVRSWSEHRTELARRTA